MIKQILIYKMLKFNYKNFIIFLVLFIIEVIHVFGDYLSVIMLYYLIKSFVKIKSVNVAITVLLIAYIVEFLQLTPILDLLSIEENSFIRIILGTTFSIIDLAAYTLGVLTVNFIDKKLNPQFSN